MSARSLNKVMLIGNLTRDPELRYTPQGTAVVTFGMATNRSWVSGDGGDRQEDTQFHRIVAWSKLAEICDQLLFKGRKVFIEGRLQTRKWTSQDGQQKETTEIVAENMMILDTRTREGGNRPPAADRNKESDSDWGDDVKVAEDTIKIPTDEEEDVKEKDEAEKKPKTSKKATKKKPEEKEEDDVVSVDDIPF